MMLHPVLAETLSAALAPSPPPSFTKRDARLSAIPKKAHAVIGMRRAGKPTFLRQIQAERRRDLTPERALYLGFDDDRLAGIGADQLGFLLEEYYRRYPSYRGRETVHWLFDAIQLLQGYLDTVLVRDVVERYAVTQVATLRWVVRQCLRNPAGSFSVHRLHRDLKAQGHGLTKDAVQAMLDHLMDAFLVMAVPLATESERQRNSNPRKRYPADPGLIKAFDASGRSNIGHALETAVSNELGRRGAEGEEHHAGRFCHT